MSQGAGGGTSRRPGVAVVAAAVTLLGTCLSLLRQAGLRSWSTPWAEDGALFLTQSWSMGWGAVVEPYSGYLHLVPRLLAEVAVLLPITLVDQFLAASSALLVAALGLFVYFATADLLPHPFGRAVLGSAFVLSPTLAQEAAANLTNLHWYLFTAAFFAMLWRPSTRPGAAVAGTVAAGAALSSPMGLLLAPIALVCAVLPRRPLRARVAPAVYAVTVAAQALVILVTYVPGPRDPVAVPEVVGVFMLRVVGPLLVSSPGTVALWRWQGQTPFVVLTVIGFGLLLAGIVAAVRHPHGGHTWWFPVLSAAVAVAAFAGPLVLRGQGTLEALKWDDLIQTGGARYTAASALLLLAALVWAVEALRRSLPAPWGSWIAVAGVVVLVGVSVLSFRASNDRSQGPLWDEGVAASEPGCAEPGTTVVRVPVAPILPGNPWGADVPCTALGR